MKHRQCADELFKVDDIVLLCVKSLENLVHKETFFALQLEETQRKLVLVD